LAIVRLMPANARYLLWVALCVAMDARAQEAAAWLDRMSNAVEQLNYQGNFVHVIGGEAETLYVVHRNDAGSIGERILSLDGPGREIVRQKDEVQCILPDRRVVLLESRTDVSPLVAALPEYSTELEPHYDFTLEAGDRVANRDTQLLNIEPRDEYRYGYKLWLDADTAMPLKSQLLDEEGRVVEQILCTAIDFFESLPASAIAPTIDTSGFTWLHSPLETPAIEGSVPWRATQVPNGFKLSAATHGSMGDSRYPVEHLVYSDGLATVSVFIEDPQTKSEVAPGFSRVGSTNAYSLIIQGRQVTAVGEVPQQTVHVIASSLTAD
jgi:sigma-E factor negative regulatory protein RseB